MAFASPIISDLLSLGTYAQDLYERCLIAPLQFREAQTELLALQTALSHLEVLTTSPVFVAGGGGHDDVATVSESAPPVLEGGPDRLAIEAPAQSNDAIAVNGNADVATVPNGVSAPPAPAGNGLPPKTRADIAQLAAGCRQVLRSFQSLLDEHQGLNDIPVKPKGRGGGGIMQLFVGRPTGAIDRYNFAQDAVQKINAIRAKLTYHTGAITLMLTVLGSNSLGRIEDSLSKLETMIAAAAEERERTHTNNVNYYLLAQQNNLNITPEKQEYLKQRQQKGMGMGPLEFQNLSEQEYYASTNTTGSGNMRGGGGQKLLKAKGEKQAGGFWGGGRAEPDEFFANINSWRPKSSGGVQALSAKPPKEKKEMGFLTSLTRRNTTNSMMSMSRSAGGEDSKKKKGDDWADNYSSWGMKSKTTKSQKLMIPSPPAKSRHSGREERDERGKGKEVKSSSSKRKEKGREIRGEEKVRKKRSKEDEPITGRIEELADDEGEAKEEGEAEKNEKKTAEGQVEPAGEADKPPEGGASEEKAEPAEGAPDAEGERKSIASVKSKHSSKTPRETEDADAAEAKLERHRRRKEREREKEKEKEKEKISNSGPSRRHHPSASSRVVPPPVPAAPAKPQKKYGWGESYFLNSWEKAEKKPAKPVIAIPVPRKKASNINIRRHSGNGRPVAKAEDGHKSSKSKHVASATMTPDEKERRRQKKEKRQREKEKEGIAEEEGAAPAAEEAKPEASAGVEGKDNQESAPEAATVETPAAEEKKEEASAEASAGEGKGGEEVAINEGPAPTDAEAVPAVNGEDEAAKKERRRKRKEAKEAAEEKEGEKRRQHHHKSSKDPSSSKSGEKGKGREKEKEKEREKDKRPEKPRRRESMPTESHKEKKDHERPRKMSRSNTTPLVDKKGTLYDYDKEQAESRRRLKAEKEAMMDPQSPTGNSPWGKKAALGLVRLTMGGQKAGETKKKIRRVDEAVI